ncbi:MAG: hypothetical protein K2L21_06525 [Muribaculaceae bacterium]|nr:hypothetical protein [Muribaculaceae bacterium]
MKKLYATVLVAVMAVVSAFQASAESITVNVDDPAAVTLTLAGQTLNISAGDNVVEYDPNGYNSLYIDAKDGFRLVDVVCVDSPDYSPWVNNGKSCSIYLGQSNDGRKYEVTTQDLSSVRTATATVTVTDDYTQVQASRNSSGKFDLTGEVTEVKFIPGEESPFTFSSKDYGSELYLVKHNGNKVESRYGSFIIDVEDGDEIEITASFPAVDVPVTFTVSEGAEGAIDYVQVNYENVDNYMDPDFTVRAGSSLGISLNSNNYVIEGVYINDELQYSTYYVSYKVGMDPVEVNVVAHPYATIDFTVNVDDPAHVNVHPGSSSYETAFTLVAGSNELSVSEKDPYVYIKAAQGYVIKSLTDAEGNPVTLSYNAVKVNSGDVFNIVTEEINYDSKFVYYVDSTDDLYTAYWSDEDSRESYTVEAGYTVIPFSSSANVLHSVVASGENPYYAYKNDEEIVNTWNSSYFSQQTYPEHGDVYKVFTTGVAPEFHALSFELTGEGTDDVKVSTDIINDRADFAAGLRVLTGTQVDIALPENDDYDYTVSLDGEELTPDENGVCTFNASADHNVVISGMSGISDVAADRNEPAAVYNLQGMKVLDAANAAALKNLPAGIYITNGTKIVVR